MKVLPGVNHCKSITKKDKHYRCIQCQKNESESFRKITWELFATGCHFCKALDSTL